MDVSRSKAAVVMCTWQRIERLPVTLDLLAAQSSETFALYIWNNNVDRRRAIDDLVRSRDRPYRIFVEHSPENIGGFGRFVLSRRLCRESDVTHVIFIDDDQEFSSEVVSGFLAEAQPQTISSRWSFRIREGGDYWDRVRCQAGEPAHYCGTCGMITDIAVFRDERLFSDCPDEFRCVEDLWLSYFAQHVLDWRLVASAVRVKTVVDGKDTYLQIRRQKVEFLEYLRAHGWEV